MRRERWKAVCARGAIRAAVAGRSSSSLDLDMRLTPDRPALRRWRLWVGAVLIAEICWFALLHPRIAGNFRPVLALALLPLTAVGYAYLIAACSPYLSDRERDFSLPQMIALIL